MSSNVRVKIAQNAKVLVSSGDAVSPHTIIAEIPSEGILKVIDLTSITGIKPKSISKYLKIGTGEEIQAGQLIFSQKSLLSTATVKSPVSGIIKEIDLNKGSITVVSDNGETSRKLTIPVYGKIKSVSRESIIIEVKEKVYPALNGLGSNFTGIMLFYPQGRLGVLDQLGDCAGSIICCNSINDDTIIKLEVMGISGIIVKHRPKYSQISYIQVDEEIFHKLEEDPGKTAFVSPVDLQIIVSD